MRLPRVYLFYHLSTKKAIQRALNTTWRAPGHDIKEDALKELNKAEDNEPTLQFSVTATDVMKHWELALVLMAALCQTDGWPAEDMSPVHHLSGVNIPHFNVINNHIYYHYSLWPL